MNILGIETSCDETSAAVVKDGKVVLSNIVASSLEEHSQYGGIIPEIASRRQMESINTVVSAALKEAAITLNNIQAIAVTASPGLIGSLLVGLSFARALSYALGKPLIEMDHIKAHLYANFLRTRNDKKKLPLPKLPAVGLIVSGGHSSLYHIQDFQHFKLLGQTRDDAAGEAYDKVARVLGLGYPGGPIIDKKAAKGKPTALRFPQAALEEGSFDFSFSGVKTAVLYHHRKNAGRSDFNINDVAYAFQDSVVSILVKKALEACLKKKVKTLVVGGGVAANSALRLRLQSEGKKRGIMVFFPPMALCVDNAAMIAGLAHHYFKK